ncbi:chondroitin AC lyase [Ephemerocybe angulata]|uniref:Chondroitin AC lyase n=1 Tax=Ephemerocybe angulata TaxID=980116 RepID=A0A8H6IHY3_9AGAR|nr:chondroitin AC lyase [Tulosesus angulatus]
MDRVKSLDGDGKWPETQVNYTTGCAAQRALWPASVHWDRIVAMAGAYRGGIPNTDQWNGNADLRKAIGSAMEYWFKRDFKNVGCLDGGGTASCPCEDPTNSLWNTNWFSNVILVPSRVGKACLLLNGTLSASEATHCGEMTTRTYGTFAKGGGYLAGANILEIARISADAAILTNDEKVLADAYRRIHDELVVRNAVKTDGILADGSFGQHLGLLYNGNYGKDYSNAALDVEIAAAGTQFQAGEASRGAFETLFEGNKWMIFRNSATKVLHWDFSAIGRMLAYPVVDAQASASINTNLTAVQELGNLWNSEALKKFANELNGGSNGANAGKLVGNKLFPMNDYMVHRGQNYVSSLKMYSTRTLNTECVNDLNPKGFHLSDGTLYTYLKGTEYEDIQAAWDWDLIPGTTVDYKNTPLTCNKAKFTSSEAFVGGLSDGWTGVSAMRYTNPNTGALKWQKSWFFLDGVYHVMVNILESKSTAPVYSVLDQKRQSGETKVEGKPSGQGATVKYTEPQTIWHDGVGYSFPPGTPVTLNVRRGPAKGEWSAIGTSTQPGVTVDLWAAWLEHNPAKLDAPVEYTIFPGVNPGEFQGRRHDTPVQTIENSQNVSAIYDKKEKRIMAVFWAPGGGSFVFKSKDRADLTVSASKHVIVTVSMKDGTITASDPTQNLDKASVALQYGEGPLPGWWKGEARSHGVTVGLPKGAQAGEAMRVEQATVLSAPETGDVSDPNAKEEATTDGTVAAGSGAGTIVSGLGSNSVLGGGKNAGAKICVTALLPHVGVMALVAGVLAQI